MTADVPPRPAPGRIVFIVCLAEILGMAPFSMFLAMQPLLRDAWTLSNTATGWISSAYFGGYMVAVPLLASLTDRYDARGVWLASTALAVAAAAGFGLLARGMWSAVLFQFIAGASLAGTYMPGLKVIADRIEGVPHPRHVAFYTTSFTIGSSLSFYAIGQLAAWLPWRAAVLAAAAGPAAAWLIASALLAPVPPGAAAARAETHWRTVARSADSLRYVVGYACHTWELFALRAWLVPFLAFCAGVQGTAGTPTITTLAALISLIGVPASLAGAELTTRTDRRRLIRAVMVASAVTSVLCGAAAGTTWVVVTGSLFLYNAVISADSAALTSGLVAVAPPGSRGTAMAVYSTAGFAAAWAGSFAVGALLDLLGGQSLAAWTMAFALMGAPNLVSAVVVGRAGR